MLKVPSYGWADDNNELVVPSKKQLYQEFFSRLNVFKHRKNWISSISWIMVLCMLPFFISFLVYHLSVVSVVFFILYAMIIMSTHGTIRFHRYCTHGAYKFSHPLWRIITQNLVIKTFPEEIYVISHHVHHAKSDEPGDPYIPKGGLLNCMMSDVNHQSIAENLDESDYRKATNFISQSGIQINSYKQYQKWGSVASPLYTISLWLINWSLWYFIFYLIGGHAIATLIIFVMLRRL
ncbi:fatty acid desaturase [Ekhidna sp.]|uniref:fatty acid desaturase n=1 Tax=Ekhidna sp. TaxID=2608089 RepID=UPI003514F96B